MFDMNDTLYKFKVHCGRPGTLRGLFLSTEDKVQEAIGEDVYFYEEVGKHSEVQLELRPEHLTKISNNSSFVNQFYNEIGESFGLNPLNYLV
jgi:hypothetical protein